MNARPWTPESRDALLTRVTALTAGTAVAGAVGALGLGAALAATTHAKSTVRTSTSATAPAGSTGSASTGAPGAGSTTTTPRTVTPGQVKVQVLNGIGVAGAARAVADQLTAAGFDVVAIGNAPGGQVSASEIVYAPAEIAAARTLAAATGVGTGSPTGTGSVVTLVLGPDWTGALPAGASGSGGAAQAPAPVQAPQNSGGVVVSGGS